MAFWGIAAPFAYGQEAASSQAVAVIDLDRILEQSKAGQSIEQQLQAQRGLIQKEFAEKENTLNDTERRLIDLQKSGQTDTLKSQRLAFEKELTETRRLFQTRRRALDNSVNQALDQLRDAVVREASAIADEGRYQAVLKKSSVVVVDARHDITGRVLERLNTRTPDIRLQINVPSPGRSQ